MLHPWKHFIQRNATCLKAMFHFFLILQLCQKTFNLLKLIELFKRQTIFNYQINHNYIGDIFAIINNKNNDKE